MPARPLARLPLLLLVLFAAFALHACTAAHSAGDSLKLQGRTPGDSSAGSTLSLLDHSPPLLGQDERARAQRAETERLLTALWDVAGNADAPGTRWEFQYWSQGGALTLLSFRRMEAGEGTAARIDRSAFLPRVSRNLPMLLGTSARAVSFSLKREEAGWEVNLGTAIRAEPPLHARTLPSSRAGTTEAGYSSILALPGDLRKWA